MFKIFQFSISLFFTTLNPIITSKIMVLGEISSTESSAEYLYNVMNQLQEHNRPSPVSVDRTTALEEDFNYHNNGPPPSFNNHQQQNEIFSTEKSTYHRYIDNSKPAQTLNDHISVFNDDQQVAESITPLFQVQAPQILKPVRIIKEPAPLGLTRKDLAKLYKNALEQGSPVVLSLLENPLISNEMLRISGNQIRLNPRNPEYYYHFYPLKTFANELQDNHGYKAIQQNIQPHHSDLAAESSKTQMANPLFVAMSSFIGMALVFMASVLFLPKFGSFGSRNSSDEFFQLTKIAWEAIEGRNCTERFACELNKVTQKFKLSKRSRRLIENIVPTNIRRKMITLRKSTKVPQECKLIKCKCA